MFFRMKKLIMWDFFSLADWKTNLAFSGFRFNGKFERANLCLEMISCQARKKGIKITTL